MRIGLLGGGPAALFMFKRIVEQATDDLEVTLFERNAQLGAGMPYSTDGACKEHITNVSGNETPVLVSSVSEWIKDVPVNVLKSFGIDKEDFSEYHVLPRLLFGKYLEEQFESLLAMAKKLGIRSTVLFHTTVVDVKDKPDSSEVVVFTEQGDAFTFDAVVMCTGHNWKKNWEEKIPNWFDSPYPPSKLAKKIAGAVAIKGSSLTAIDAVRTLARQNGNFAITEDQKVHYQLAEGSGNFKIVLHSLGGYLPAIRFHLADTHLSPGAALTEEEVYKIKEANSGFVPLDYLFERNFMQPLQKQNPDFYAEVKGMSIEEFVAHMMSIRERLDAFQLFRAEFAEAEKSIKRRQSVVWKETLASLSYAMNYPAKHLSAEDMLRLKKVLMPLISIVIAFVPQSSCRELLALHDAGVLSLVSVDAESKVEPLEEGGAVYSYKDDDGQQQVKKYPFFVDAVGQPPMLFNDFPFDGLKHNGTVSAAHLLFASAEAGAQEIEKGNSLVKQDSQGQYYLQLPGISINDHFQVLDRYGAYNNRIYIMAVPYIGGLNPDYSGLDFCETASARIAKAMFLSKEGMQV